MTAPLSVSRPSASGEGLSVSPRDVPPPLIATTPRSRSNPVFITPRVIDQRAFDERALTLRSIIEDATAASRQLATQIAQAEGAEASVTNAAADLQDRLRLGARMLSAFQSQIVRIEEALAELDRREQGLRVLATRAAAELGAGAD